MNTRYWFTVLPVTLLLACGGNTPTDSGVPDTGVPTDVPGDTVVPTDTPSGLRAGAACTPGDTCRTGLTCEESVPGQEWPIPAMCTAGCTNNASQSNEQMQCGGAGATCLTLGDADPADPPVSLCAQTCSPSAMTGSSNACRAGYVCTGWWYTHDGLRPDTTGCFPFCSSNADCGGMPCNTRSGDCGEATDTTGLTDGQPCNPNADPDPCRGFCWQETDVATQGLCVSFINLAVSRTCPDPGVERWDVAAGPDNIGICNYKTCTRESDCMAPTHCIADESGLHICTYGEPEDGGVPTDAGTDAGTDATAPSDSGTDAGTDASAG